MTQEDKELLLMEICARLPYGVHCCVLNFNKTIKEDNDIIYGIVGGNIVTLKSDKDECYMYYQIKPYLRPMSSMTEEEIVEINSMGFAYWTTMINNDLRARGPMSLLDAIITHHKMVKLIDWLNAHHFDYRGLIEKGLAIEAPEGMYNIKGQ